MVLESGKMRAMKMMRMMKASARIENCVVGFGRWLPLPSEVSRFIWLENLCRNIVNMRQKLSCNNANDAPFGRSKSNFRL